MLLIIFYTNLILSNSVFAQNSAISPTLNEIKCQINAECVLVDSGCNGCCQREAIAVASSMQFKMKVQACTKKWKGPVCDCSVEQAKAVCKNSKCEIEFTKK